MKIIDKVKLDRTESCGSRSPLSIILDVIKKIKECDESVEVLLNDYDWLLSLRYIIQINDMPLKIIEKGKEDTFLKIEVIKECI
ncbi:hypothetical protein [Sulfurisphaera tokodaii]|uniref:Uncharacterized protein n=2 Tax=Sulfurisphaera tokodaii TaxID=111955 RepID=F9VPH6_SULTO|nr:hypothetical protein [Sulfurisphaera tokodaii]BAK54823.1 hypothetical protein STK_25635 [Sulfurisphaera tokodaii str. 7]HII73764.1 hypothetical protein [Sulfurisphaera tokodaii]